MSKNVKKEKRRAEKYIKGVMNALEGATDAECIKTLTENTIFWYLAALFWSRGYQKLSKEQYYKRRE